MSIRRTAGKGQTAGSSSIGSQNRWP